VVLHRVFELKLYNGFKIRRRESKKPETAGKAIISGPCSGGHVGKEMIVFAFPAPFFGSFFGRAKNEHITRPVLFSDQ
jgi:hypothetical protein